MDRFLRDKVLEFTHYPATTGISLAYLIDERHERRGVYVLTFSDGTEYVGQAADVLTRFRTHARKFGTDIVCVDFAPVSRPNLDTLEVLTIRWRLGEGAKLRNKLMIRQKSYDVPQNHWLPQTYPLSFRIVAADAYSEADDHSGRVARDAEPLRDFARLREHREADRVIAALAAFVQHGVPLPALTEQRAWVVTAMQRSDDGLRRLACLTVQNLQLLTFVDDVRGQTHAEINLAPWPRVDSRYQAQDFDYQSVNGIMQHASLWPETVVEALAQDQDFRSAARTAASGLLHKGPSLIGRFHCRPLADAIYANIYRTSQQRVRPSTLDEMR